MGTLVAAALSRLARAPGVRVCDPIDVHRTFLTVGSHLEFKEPVQVPGYVGAPVFRAVWEMRDLMIFIFIMGIVPEVNSVLFFVLKRDIDPVAMSLVDICGALSASLVAAAYNYLKCKDRTSWSLAIWLNIVCTVMALAILTGAPPLEYACVRAALLGVGSMFYVLPVVIFVAACPNNAEAPRTVM